MTLMAIVGPTHVSQSGAAVAHRARHVWGFIPAAVVSTLRSADRL